MRQPRRRSLVAETADALREACAGGELRGAWPGERALAARLGVGRDTVRDALRALERDGWISPAGQGRRRRLRRAPGRAHAAGARRRVVLLAPVRREELPPRALLELDALRSHLADHGWALETAAPRVFDRADPAPALARAAAALRARAWLLYQCPLPVQDWFARGRERALIWGSPLPGIDLPAVDTDWEAAAFHAGASLARLGHRRAGLIVPAVPLAGTQAAERGLTRSLGVPRRLADLGHRDGLLRVLAAAFAGPAPPTALVATRARQALTVLAWAAATGRRVPRDLSLVSLADEPWFLDVLPDIARYRTSLDALTRALVRKLDDLTSPGGARRSAVRIVPEYVPGDSLAPP